MVDPWRFQAHPEVWLLMVSLIASYVYMVRVIGPKAVPVGERVVSGKQIAAFTAGISLLWFGSDWPVHDIGEQYLYSVHMFQHMIFSYFAPPLLLLSLPTWMARVLLGTGRTYRVGSWLSKPVVAGLWFNGIVMITHIPGVVNTSTENAVLHYSLHFLVVTAALMMWTPVCGPIEEWRMGPGGKCIYLFLMSVVPTVPAGWLTFAEGVVYKHYSEPVRVWGISVTDDQQIAGAIMKIGGAMYLWAITIFIFFKRFSAGFDGDNSYVRKHRIPDAEITGNDERELTYDQVTAAFDRSRAPASAGSAGAGAPSGADVSLEAEHSARDER
jgi:putative membrane protein